MKANIAAVLTVLTLFLASAFGAAEPQNLGATGTLQGSVTDPSGAVISGASVQINNRVTNYSATVVTDGSGLFAFRKVPFNHYRLTVAARGFANTETSLDVISPIAQTLKLTLNIAASQTVVNVEGGATDLLETETTNHVDIDSSLIERMPVSATSALSSVIEQSSPGVVSDSNGSFHPLGEHSDTSFVIDNQPVNDQQSRTFSNQIATSTIDSMEAISGVAPAEFGDKASLVVRTTTKSGLGVNGVHGGISGNYGSFGTSSTSINLSAGNQRWGNFVAIDGTNSGRFLDTPEYRPLHAHGNAENIFDRIDNQLSIRCTSICRSPAPGSSSPTLTSSNSPDRTSASRSAASTSPPDTPISSAPAPCSLPTPGCVRTASATIPAPMSFPIRQPLSASSAASPALASKPTSPSARESTPLKPEPSGSTHSSPSTSKPASPTQPITKFARGYRARPPPILRNV